MKTLFSICLIAVLSASTFAQTKRVAVVQFQADKLIESGDMFGGLDNDITRHFTKIAEDPRFNVMPILEQFHSLFFKDFAPKMPVEVLPENVVLNNPAYKNFFQEVKKNPTGQKLLALAGKVDAQQNVTIKGYQPLIEEESTGLVATLSGTAKNAYQVQLMRIFDDQADGVMFFSLGFTMGSKKSLLGTLSGGTVQDGRMLAYGDIRLYNRKGQKVFAIRKVGFSEQKYDRVLGSSIDLKPEDLLPMCESAAKNLFKELEESFPKMTRKVDAKL